VERTTIAGETEVLGENLPQHHLVPPQIPHDQVRFRTPDRSGGKPATNRLSYGAALPVLIVSRPFSLRKFPGAHFCQWLSQLHDHSKAGRSRSDEESSGFIGNQTRDLPFGSTVPQPITLPPVVNLEEPRKADNFSSKFSRRVLVVAVNRIVYWSMQILC
jgi:hypothetical protein